ncbi:MAG: molybdopterin-binding protein [Burkholderiaceae bacterium]|jgi:molybdopterin-biosynthesis enzyme MoeA-like protein
MAFGIIIIGDEILSGKRTDKHLAKYIELLSARGLQLAWAEYLGDDPQRLTATLRRTLASEDIVFSCGGIGATPDDHTRQCAANALGVNLVLHPQAREKINERIADVARESGNEPDYSAADNMHRLKMGEFPQGADIIPNPFNKIPGFSVKNLHAGAHYFVPGFPVMAAPMMEWVLDTCYAPLFHQTAYVEKSVFVYESMESLLTPLMEAIEAQYPGIKIFSLPSVGDAQRRRHIELGVKGEPALVELSFAQMLAGLDMLRQEYVLAA